MNWSQYTTYRTNDNVFVFNRMLGCNTALYDDVEKWKFDRVNDLSTTCYIKFSKNRYNDIQLVANMCEKIMSS